MVDFTLLRLVGLIKADLKTLVADIWIEVLLSTYLDNFVSVFQLFKALNR